MKSRPFLPILLALILAIALFSTQAAWAGSKYQVIYDFYGSGSNGGPPIAAPVLDAGGNLCGPAAGGVGNWDLCSGPCGVVYQLTRGARGKWTESVVFNVSTYFNLAPLAGILAFDRQGNLYGILGGDGAGSNWVYQLTPSSNGWGFNLIYEGYGPDAGGLLPDGAGNLYGAVGVGSAYRSTLGKMSPGSSGWIYTNLYTFCATSGNCPDGAEPIAPFSWDTKGNLYGADHAGGIPRRGTNGLGVAFRMTPNRDGTWTYHVLHRFGSVGTDGRFPWGGLTVDASGNAYGTTLNGGPNGAPYGNGTVFKLALTSRGEWKETLVYGFPNVNLGAFPWGNLVLDKAGNLYGVNNGGKAVCGVYLCGQVFKLTLEKGGKWKYSVVHQFTGPDGAYPYGVVIDKQGNLFGTAWGGGTYNYGVVFEITP
jgi:hypothetical protein